MTRPFFRYGGLPVLSHDAMPAQSIKEVPDIRAHRLDVRFTRRTQSVDDLRPIASFIEQIKNLRGDGTEAEHLASFDVQKDPAVRGSRSSNRARDDQHWTTRLRAARM
jgi:hypothetical protein